MTIHSEHPFTPDPADRDQLRRFRSRLGPQVSLWASGEGTAAVGLTVSSMMVSLGDPGFVLGLIDPDSDLADELAVGTRLAVQLLEWRHRDGAEQFAGQMPAPGGPFARNPWEQTPWGPVLEGVTTWIGARVVALREVGWSSEVQAEVERVVIGGESHPLVHRRGHYA